MTQHDDQAPRVALTADQALERLIAGNERFVKLVGAVYELKTGRVRFCYSVTTR